jgi:hypothetical protein
VFNLLPGQGLGYKGNKNIAFGLGDIISTVVTALHDFAGQVLKIFIT